MVDTVMKRKILKLIASDPQTYNAEEEHEYTVTTPEIDVSGLKRKHLMNVGLLMIEGGKVVEDQMDKIVSINMVVNVSADTETGGLQKLVINPIDT